MDHFRRIGGEAAVSQSARRRISPRVEQRKSESHTGNVLVNLAHAPSEREQLRFGLDRNAREEKLKDDNSMITVDVRPGKTVGASEYCAGRMSGPTQDDPGALGVAGGDCSAFKTAAFKGGRSSVIVCQMISRSTLS